MQIAKSQGNIVEKVLRDKDGKFIRARFFVYENGGRIKARLLDFVYLTEKVLLEGVNFLLTTVMSKRHFDTKSSIVKTYTTPLFILNTIYFSGSKPRAPTLI